MARKLRLDEATVLMEAVPEQERDSVQEEQIKSVRVTAGHETALLLSPESGAWFGIEIPGWSDV